MSARPFRELLAERTASGDAILADGAWGTMLMARGLPHGDAPERWNLERPDVLAEIAGLYLEAGAELLTTNTFGASPLRLRAHGLEERTEEICRSAVSALRCAAGESAIVSASVGPTGRLLLPAGDTEPEEVSAAFERQIAALAGAGADVVCVETMTDLLEATLAVMASRKVAPALPVIATMTFDPTPRGFFTVMGISVERAVAGLLAAGADLVGSNCGNGIEGMIGVARELRKQADRCGSAAPIAIRANAGLPTLKDGLLAYPEPPERFAARLPGLLDAGVSLLGGCCGTTPEHVRAMRRALDARRAGHPLR